jgi:hypothetical protein
VAKEISPIARPREIHVVPEVPKTRSGKGRAPVATVFARSDSTHGRLLPGPDVARVVAKSRGPCWVARPANRERAWEFFQHLLKSDVSAVQGGTTSEGVHLAAMAGSVDLVQRCFTGLEIRGDRIVLSARWPETFGVFAFPIHLSGVFICTSGSAEGARSSARTRATRTESKWDAVVAASSL